MGRLILTPTARLARACERQLAESCVAAGKASWPAPRVLHFTAWLAELRQAALLAGVIDRAPVAEAGAGLLWQQVIDTDVFAGEPRVHGLAERAWRTIHEYRLAPPRKWPELWLNADSRQFCKWAGRFEALSAEREVIDEWSFAGRLPDWIADGRLELPEAIDLAGFELPPAPLQEAIFAALAKAGVELKREEQPDRLAAARPPVLAMQAFERPGDELHAAALWARTRLEQQPEQRIAVVVPDLGGRTSSAARVFRQVFDPPGSALYAAGAEPWHISLGQPLADWPPVADALALLRLDPARISQPEAGRLLRSPYLAGQEEAGARAQATADLMREAPYEITAYEWIRTLQKSGAHRLADRLGEWRALRERHRSRAGFLEWVGRFQEELDTLGFGRGRPPDSREYQVLERWRGLLQEFAALDAVGERPLSRSRALAVLAERAAATTFREQNPGCPIEILGVEEAIGARFDALWITTLDADTWPPPVRRDALIPSPLQQELPAGSHGCCLERARAKLAGLLRTTEHIRGSYTTGSDEQPRMQTRLVKARAADDDWTAPLPESISLETSPDHQAPQLKSTTCKGGTRLLQHQSACPFRAFAEHRLAAPELKMPRPGLDALARGRLLHRALEHFWAELPGRTALAALAGETLSARIQAAGEHALARLTRDYRLALTPAAQVLEQACLERTLQRWLNLERERGDFRVTGRESAIEMAFGGLRLAGRIDRIDQTPAGEVLVDYKSGSSGKNGWKPEPRIEDPQLPAYALAREPRPVAIAFARLRPDKLGFDGLSRSDTGIPGVGILADTGNTWKHIDDWDELLAHWQAILDDLARNFADGRAEVDPRKPEVCKYCHLHALCRIHERRPLAGLDNAVEEQ